MELQNLLKHTQLKSKRSTPQFCTFTVLGLFIHVIDSKEVEVDINIDEILLIIY